MTHTSGTPPTRVLTVNNPQLAASSMAMQKASVKELPMTNKTTLARVTTKANLIHSYETTIYWTKNLYLHTCN